MSSSPDPFGPAKLGPLTLRNRIIKPATFEGMTGTQTVEERLVEFHRRTAAGGVGMTTLGFLAVSPDGAATPNELVLTDERVPELARLAEVVHGEGAAVSAQVGHAGAVASVTGHKAISPSAVFSKLSMSRTREASRADLERVKRDFAAAARRLAEAGFDAIEVHLGHGYLLSEFFSPKLNRRTDAYGGTLEKRTRFPREVLRAVREEVGDRLAVLGKFNMADGVPGGLWLDQSVEIARLLESDGSLDAIELTVGSSLENTMYTFRGEAPLHEMAASMPGPVKLGLKLFGRFIFKSYPFEEAYLLPYARQFRAAVSMPLVLLGGVNKLETIQQAMSEGFDFVAMGRALLREPDLILRYAAGSARDSLCVHCNKCIPTIYQGTHCVIAAEKSA